MASFMSKVHTKKVLQLVFPGSEENGLLSWKVEPRFCIFGQGDSKREQKRLETTWLF